MLKISPPKPNPIESLSKTVGNKNARYTNIAKNIVNGTRTLKPKTTNILEISSFNDIINYTVF
jgi:hypothetical protein